MWSKQISSKLFTDAEPRTQLNILLNEILAGITQDLGDMYKICFLLLLMPCPDQCLTKLSSQE